MERKLQQEPASRGMTLVRVPLESIRCEALPPRESLEPLMESISRFGLLEPVGICRQGEGFALLYGRRRLAACKALELTHINAILLSPTPEEKALLPAAENLHQCAMTLAEKARRLEKTARALGCEALSAGHILNISTKQLQPLLAFLQLPEKVQALAEQENLNEKQIAQLCALRGEDAQCKAVQKIVQRAIAPISREDGFLSPPGIKLSVYSDKRLFINALRDIASQMRRAGYAGSIYEREGELVIHTAEEKHIGLAQ